MADALLSLFIFLFYVCYFVILIAILLYAKRKRPDNRVVALLFSIFAGNLGFDRFYLGKIGTGVLKLITLGGLGIWWLIDIFFIALGGMRDKEGNELKD